jgi:hypothetical protein
MSAVLRPDPSSGEHWIPPAPAGRRADHVGYGFSLPVVYLVWLGVVAALYPVCRRYAALKASSRVWPLSYL